MEYVKNSISSEIVFSKDHLWPPSIVKWSPLKKFCTWELQNDEEEKEKERKDGFQRRSHLTNNIKPVKIQTTLPLIPPLPGPLGGPTPRIAPRPINFKTALLLTDPAEFL